MALECKASVESVFFSRLPSALVQMIIAFALFNSSKSDYVKRTFPETALKKNGEL